MRRGLSVVTVYQIEAEPTAPVLMVQSPEVGVFDGGPKGELSAGEPFVATVCQAAGNPRQFYGGTPGLLVLPEEAWLEEDLQQIHYCCSLATEMLSLKTEHGCFVGVNPAETLHGPAGSDGGCPVDRICDSCLPLFRLAGQDPTSLFCVEGVDVEDFKALYEAGGFRGLRFEQVWRGVEPV